MSASFVFPPQPLPSLPIAGRTDRFPVRRVFCVGLNYADHTREMGGDPAKTRPMFFTKPADAVVPEGARCRIRRRPTICTTRSSLWWR